MPRIRREAGFAERAARRWKKLPGKDPEKRKKKRGWIAAVVIIAAVGVMIAAFLIVRNVREKQEYEKNMDSAEKYLEELDYENAEASYLKAIEIDPKGRKIVCGAGEGLSGAGRN